MSIGGLLVNIKNKLPHGQWEPWAQKNLPFSLPTAWRWIKLFENRNELKSFTVKDLTINQAYKLLAGPVVETGAEVIPPMPSVRQVSVLPLTPSGAEQARLEKLCAAVREADKPLPHGPESIPIIEQWLAAVWNLIDWLLLPGVYEKFGGTNRDEIEQCRTARAEAEAGGAA